MNPDPIILLVDDSPNDALLMATVFKQTGFEKPLRFALTGEDAIAYLKGEGRYADRVEFPMPAVVLLDLNMPRKNGFEVLAWIRSQPTLDRIHVHVLSASGRREDIDRAYGLGASAYLVKPGNLDELLLMAKALLAWMKLEDFAGAARPSGDSESIPVGARAEAFSLSSLSTHPWAR